MRAKYEFEDALVIIDGDSGIPFKFEDDGSLVWTCAREGGCGWEVKVPESNVRGGQPEVYGGKTPPPITRIQARVRQIERQIKNLKGCKDASDYTAAKVADIQTLDQNPETSPADEVMMQVVDHCPRCNSKAEFNVTIQVLPNLLAQWQPWLTDPIEIYQKYGLDVKNPRTVISLGRLREKYGSTLGPLKMAERLMSKLDEANKIGQPIIDSVEKALDAIPEADAIFYNLERDAKVIVGEGRVRELLRYRLRATLLEIFGAIESPSIEALITPTWFAPPPWLMPEPEVNPLEEQVFQLHSHVTGLESRLRTVTRQRDNYAEALIKARQGR